MFDKDDDIEIMRGLIERLPRFNFLSFNKSAITRIEGSGTSKANFCPISCFLEKRDHSAIYWRGKGMKVEVQYYSGILCLDQMIIEDAPTIVEDSGLWWASCYFTANNAENVKRQNKVFKEQSMSRPMAIVGTTMKHRFTALKMGFTNETDAVLYALTAPSAYIPPGYP